MPNTSAATKALRQAKKRALRNALVKKTYKTAVKQVAKAIDVAETDILPLLYKAQKQLDKAAKRGVIKKNTAARKLSRLAKKIHQKKKQAT